MLFYCFSREIMNGTRMFFVELFKVLSHYYFLYERNRLQFDIRNHRTWHECLLINSRYQFVSLMSLYNFSSFQSTLKRQADFSVSNPNDTNQTVVLIIDRREDAITPLLNQV